MANRIYEQVLGESFFTLVINGYTFRIYARVLKLYDFDIILEFD
jgi:hypothetical protein